MLYERMFFLRCMKVIKVRIINSKIALYKKKMIITGRLNVTKYQIIEELSRAKTCTLDMGSISVCKDLKENAEH